MEKGPVILGLVALTSVAACALIAIRARLSARAVRGAIVGACETIGLMLIFVVANAAVWSAFVVASRMLTRHSPSFYVLADDSLFALSGLQALVFVHWFGSSSTRCPREPRSE